MSGTFEPRPTGIRISALSSEERATLAKHRLVTLAELLKASGCAVEENPKNLVLNFDTGRHAMVLQFDHIDPRRIKLMLAFGKADGDIVRARWACFEATAKQFASKATAADWGSGFIVEFSVGVYAEALHAFGDSLKAYVEDIEKLYDDWVSLMVLDD